MFKVIIFDLDGTLIETQPIGNEAARMAFAKHGHSVSEEEILSIAGVHPADFVPKLLESRGYNETEVHNIIADFKKFYHEIWDEDVALKGDVKSLCENLKSQGIQVGLVTTSSKPTVDKFIEKFNLQDIFEIIVTSSDITKTKPDPEPYLVAIERFSRPKEDILVIEDSNPGLVSAKLAGLKVAIVPSDYTSHQDFSSADFKLNSLEDILNLPLKP